MFLVLLWLEVLYKTKFHCKLSCNLRVCAIDHIEVGIQC